MYNIKPNYFIAAIMLLLFSSCQKNINNEISLISSDFEKNISFSDAISRLTKENSVITGQPEEYLPVYNEEYAKVNIDSRAGFANNFPTQPNTCKGSPTHVIDNSTSVSRTVSRNDTYGETLTSGALLRHSFVRGRVYEISFSVAIQASMKNMAAMGLQIGFNNIINPVPIAHCGTRINLKNYGSPYVDITGLTTYEQTSDAGQTIQFVTKTVTLVADDCYPELWYNFVAPSYPLNFTQTAYIRNLKIKDITSAYYEMRGNNNFVGTTENIYDISFAGNRIGENFQWSVTGNLQIVGSNTGQTVRVKSSSPTDFYGEIIATLPNCYSFIMKRSFSKCVEFSNAKINGPSETGFGQYLQFNGGAAGSSTFEWTVQGLPEGSTISGLNNQNLNVTIPSKNSSHPNSGYFTLNLRTTNSCGYILNVTKHVNYSHFGSGPGDDVGPEG